MAITESSSRQRTRTDTGPLVRQRTTTSESRVLSLAPSPPASPPSGEFFHLFMELRAFVASPCLPQETAELFFSLYSKTLKQFITEEFVVIMDHHGTPVNDPHASVRTLFQDLGPQDTGDAVLVCKIIRCGAMKMSAVAGSPSSSGPRPNSRASHHSPPDGSSPNLLSSSSSSNPTSGSATSSTPSFHTYKPTQSAGQFRRPFGCAVANLGQFVKDADNWEVQPFVLGMQIFVPIDEAEFASLHEDIIQNRTHLFERSARWVSAC